MTPRFLLVRFSAIGDCVMATWAATAIRTRYPDAFISWAVESRCADVIERTRLASQVEEFPRDRWKRQRWAPRVWRDQVMKYGRLRRHHFDFGIDLQGHTKTALCLRLAAPRRRIAARATDSLSAQLNPVMPPQPSDVHVVEWNHRTLATLGDFELPSRPIMPESSPPSDFPSGRPVVTIAVSAGSPSKTLKIEQWDAVAARMIAGGFDVVSVGGTGDPHLHAGTDFVGRLRLSETISVIAASDLMICGDTGAGHIAAAVGTPVVSVFGPADPAWFRPYTARGTVLREGKDARSVSPDAVAEAAFAYLG